MITILLGKRIQELRKQTGLSQEKFALKIGMDRTYFASVEAGKRNVAIRNIKKIADGLGVTLSDSDKSTLIQLYNKFKNMDLDENELRSQVNKVYDKLESLGITKEDVKGILGKLVELVKGFLN